MTFLKQLGINILKGIAIFSGFAPLIQQVLPQNAQGAFTTVSKDITEIGNVIVQAEAMGAALGLPGADKLRAAAPMVAQIILQSSMLVGHEVADPALFNTGCASVASGMADVLNSLKAK